MTKTQKKAPFKVIVGNITIYSGNNYMTACGKFRAYVEQYKTKGRAYDESIVMMQGDEIRKKYIGVNDGAVI
jgi:hypothetical protein